MSNPLTIEPDAWCAWCGDPLPEREERLPWMKYCSAKCGNQYRYDLNDRPKHKHPPRPCAYCGTVFTPKFDRGTYCSRPCQWTARNRAVAKTRQGKDAPGG